MFVGGRVKSGNLDPASPARQSSIPRSGSFTEARRVSLEGWMGLGMARLAGARAVAGTPCAGQTPAISCSGEVESARGRTAEALAGFIGAGVGRGHGRGLARRRARGFGRRGCFDKVRARRTRGGVFLPLFKRLLRSQTCKSWQKSGADLFLTTMAISCM
jgi:hypothetical protein